MKFLLITSIENVQAPLVCEFDWEMDDLEEYVAEKMEEEEIEGA
jgi:hypothetical protein